MYCQNCGEKLEIKNQRFCQNCGNKIQIISETPQLGIEDDQYKITPASPPVYQIIEQKSVKKGSTSSNSKICLGFGIISLVIATFAFNFGTTILMNPVISYYFLMRRVLIGLTIVNILGIIFGIISKLYSEKAKEMEPESSILKAGNIIGFIGIIFNAILVVIAILMIWTRIL